ncbi:chemotaxis protein CheC [Fictibacillus phosphorivorans]|uniref:chemotaxis protein CheC n=1 Tax=Fictibacillus phosphorivorans TaxID=1221500 RepID=UPI0020414E96|nr:chemotaxis protein CheC [Fictibacillus phosphorivorans]MCM3717136.1 chemotaxis protein CheC [Fictibacillus phosphorivorans]MCM3774823.1 chemotaxis protein CheC [Fictibacillus phosphorivorans]
MDLTKINHLHLDILREIGNIGAGHAATALSTMLNKAVDMKVPSVNVISFEEIMEMVGGSENIVASVFLRIVGDAPGCMFFMLPIEQAETLLGDLLGGEAVQLTEGIHSEMTISALQEVGNILSGSYLTSFSDFTGLNLQPSVPATSIDMAGAILSFGLFEISAVSDLAIVIDTAFTDIRRLDEVKGHFFLMPDPESFAKIFNALGVPMDE